MPDDADPSRAEQTPEFRSPKRALARAFRLSRDRWKQKAGQRRQQIKALQVRVRDLQTSRDLWKDKALHLQAQFQQLQAATPPQADGHAPIQLAQADPADSAPAPPGPKTPTGEADPAAGGQPPPRQATAPSTAAEGPASKKAPPARR